MPNIDNNGYFINKSIDREYYKIFENESKKNKNYFKKLSYIKKKECVDIFKNILKEINTPLQFIIINSNMDHNTKHLALNIVLQLNDLEKDSSEYHKLHKWINELIQIPFNKYIQLPVNNESPLSE